MRQYMAKIERDQIMEKKNLEETWVTFEEVLNDAVKKYISSKRITSGAKQRTTPTPEMEKTIRNMPKQETKTNGNLKICQRFQRGTSRFFSQEFYKYVNSKTKVRQGISDLE